MNNNILLLLKNMEIHEKIRTIRQSKGLTQDNVADEIGIDTVNYGRIERGQAKLTMDRFIKIAEILQISPTLFFEKNKEEDSDDMLFLLNKIYETEKQILEQMKFNGSMI